METVRYWKSSHMHYHYKWYWTSTRFLVFRFFCPSSMFWFLLALFLPSMIIFNSHVVGSESNFSVIDCWQPSRFNSIGGNSRISYQYVRFVILFLIVPRIICLIHERFDIAADSQYDGSTNCCELISLKLCLLF